MELLPPKLLDSLAIVLAQPCAGWAGDCAAALRVDDTGAVPRVLAARAIAAGTVLVFPHVMRSTKARLASDLLVAEAPTLMELRRAASLDDSTDTELAFWRVARAAVDEGPNGHTRWVLEMPPLMWMRHSGSTAVARVLQLRDAQLPSELASGASALCFESDVAAEFEVTRDARFPAAQPRSLSRAVAALAALPRWRWASAAERDALAAAVAAVPATAGSLRRAPPRARLRSAAAAVRDEAASTVGDGDLRVFTDYPLWAVQLRMAGIKVVDDASAATALWLVTPVRDFGALGTRLVNQFPFEGCLVRKDLLPATCRAAGAAAAAEAAGAAAGAALGVVPMPQSVNGAAPPATLAPPTWPPWFLPSFDLATDAHGFLAAAASADDAGDAALSLDAGAGVTAARPPAWIIKRATGTHSGDPCVTDRPLVALRYGEETTPGGDRIVQRYADAPLLLAGGRKFDLRVYVAVSAFAPTLVAAYHTEYYARTAAEPYACGAGRYDAFAPHYSVGFYEGVASGVLTRGALAASARDEAGVDWDVDVEPRLAAALSQLFGAAGRCYIGGPWPHSRALYGVDVLVHWVRADDGNGGGGAGGMFDAGGRPPGPTAYRLQPTVLEVNFAGDITSLVSRLPDDGSRGCRADQRSFVADVTRMLFGAGAGDGIAAGAPVGWRAL